MRGANASLHPGGRSPAFGESTRQSRGYNITEAVRSALNEALDHDHARLAERKREIARLLSRFNRMAQLRPGLTDTDLDDESGTPIL